MKDGPTVLEYARQLAGERELHATVARDGTDRYRFRVTATGGIEVTAGSERGVLYAVYDALDGKAAGDESPAFSIRGLNPCESLARHSPEQIRTLIDRMGRWRMNTIIIHSLYGYRGHRVLIERECAKRGIELVHYTYYNLSFCGAIPRRHFAKARTGEPKPQGDRLLCSDRLCASDPEGLRLYREGVKRFLAEHPDYDRLLFATSDGYHYCECPACRDLKPIGQWEPFFRAMKEQAGDRRVEALIYTHRYALPDDLSVMDGVGRVLFDTHIRNRREPIDGSAFTKYPRYPDSQSEADSRAAGQPTNRYLYDRLVDWRGAFAGTLYVFENLMIQSAFGLPWPNTSVYLRDIATFRREGVEGIVYEAYETGIKPFLPIFDRIAEALWEGAPAYAPGPFERRYLELADRSDWPGHADWDEERDDYPYPDLARLIADFKHASDWEHAGELLRHLLARPDRDDFDWLYIGHKTLWVAHRQTPIPVWDRLGEREQAFLETQKLWDFMEMAERPRETAGEIIRTIVERLSAGSDGLTGCIGRSD